MRENLDLSVPAGRLMFQIIGAMAEFERRLISEMVTAGMRHAKSRGVHVGRPSVQVDAARIRELRDSGLGFREIAAELKVSVGTLYNKLRFSLISHSHHNNCGAVFPGKQRDQGLVCRWQTDSLHQSAIAFIRMYEIETPRFLKKR